jgi:two-component system phosphate regulon response regulator PhoB
MAKLLIADDLVPMGPGPNGFDVCRELKASDDTKGIPIVMLTAHDSESDRAVGFAAGASQYLTKPFGPLELIDTIRTILAPAS